MSVPNVNQINSQFARMSDSQLQQYASLHKDDPYIMSLAMSESGRRKEIRGAAQGAQGGDQSKIVDREIAGMSAEQLPENSGIATLPERSMARMAAGGITSFADEGAVKSDNKDAYRQYAMQQAANMGVDPQFANSIFGIESGYNPNATSPTGPVGVGQLTKATGAAYGVAPEDRKDPYKNIDASLKFMADLNKKYAGDPQKMAVAYNQGETVLNKHLQANAGELNPSTLKPEAQNYLQKLAKTATSLVPIGTAQAAPAAGQGYESQIPGGGNAPAPIDSRSFMGRAADYVGIPEEYQRNISNTANALGGWTSPVAAVGKGVNTASGALAPTAEAIAEAARLKNVAGTVRLAPPAKAGLESLDAAAQATRSAADLARRTRGVAADVRTAEGAAKSIDAANATSKAALGVEKTIAAGPAQAAKLSDMTRKGAQIAAATGDIGTPSAPEAAPAYANFGVEDGPWGGDKVPTPKEEKAIVSAVKEAVPAKERKGLSGEDLLALGLGMMAGKSQYAMQNIGEAGLSMLAGRAARTKAEQDALKSEAEIAGLKSSGKYHEALATSIASGEKLDAASRQKAAGAIETEMTKWGSSAIGMMATPAEQAAKRAEITAEVFRNFGVPTTTGTMAAPAPSTTGWGVPTAR